MNPGDVIAVLITVLLPTLFLFYVFRRWFTYTGEQLEVKRSQPLNGGRVCGKHKELEQRVRVLEQIATDAGAQTATQIEALRNASAPTRNPCQQRTSASDTQDVEVTRDRQGRNSQCTNRPPSCWRQSSSACRRS